MGNEGKRRKEYNSRNITGDRRIGYIRTRRKKGNGATRLNITELKSHRNWSAQHNNGNNELTTRQQLQLELLLTLDFRCRFLHEESPHHILTYLRRRLPLTLTSRYDLVAGGLYCKLYNSYFGGKRKRERNGGMEWKRNEHWTTTHNDEERWMIIRWWWYVLRYVCSFPLCKVEREKELSSEMMVMVVRMRWGWEWWWWAGE